MAELEADDEAWLQQLARAVIPYLDASRIPDGEWVRLERRDGSAISVRLKTWPELERRAQALLAGLRRSANPATEARTPTCSLPLSA